VKTTYHLKFLIMMHKNLLTYSAGLLLSFGLLTSCSKDDPAPVNTPKNIVQIVADDPGNFSSLKTALDRTGLTAVVQAGTNWTVFAPTNAAFTAANINTATLDTATLKSVLLYHVLNSKVNSSAVTTASVATVNTKNIYTYKTTAGVVYVNGFKVSGADVAATNGVVQVIDGVLIPPTKTVVEIATGSTTFSLLVQAIVKAGALPAVQAATDAAPITVFAPDNPAFAAAGLDSAAIAGLTQTAALGVVGLHVIGTGRVFSPQLMAGPVTTLAGANSLTVQTSPAPGVRATSNTTAPFSLVRTTKQGTSFDIVCTNGVIHVIDRTIRP
jgi:uncharacterized surface protein with fasciclin (FAS1) repeats